MGWVVSQPITERDGVDIGGRGLGCSIAEGTKLCGLGTFFLSILAITSERVWAAQGRVGIILFLRMQQVKSEAA